MGENFFQKLTIGVLGGIILRIIIFFFGDRFLKAGNKIRFWFNSKNLPRNLKSRFIDVNNQTNINIRNSKTTIKGLNQLQRFEVDEIKKAWNGGINGLLLVGEAGTGKSGITAILAGELQKEKHFVLLLNADEIRTPIDNFRKDYFQGQSIFTFLRELTEFKECYILFDQLDSVQNLDQLEDIGKLLQELSMLAKVRVLGVSRIYEADTIQGIKSLLFQRIESDSLSKDDAEKYLERLEVNNPSKDLVGLSQNLLNLSLIAEVVDIGEDVTEITGELELWELFLSSIFDREGGKALNLLSELAIDEAKNLPIKISFIEKYLPSHHRSLISRHLILPIRSGKYRFFHRKFRDFLCAKKLISEDYSPSHFLEQFGFSNGTSIINWVLTLFRKDGPNVENDFIQQTIEDKGLPFYVRAAIFDSYLEKPLTDLDIQLVRDIFSNQEYEKYFFTNLNSPEWVDYFNDIGFFLDVPDPMPAQDQPGYVQFPLWFAGEYLKNMASQFPEVVKDTALNIQTENIQAFRVMLDALLLVPPEIAAGAVPVFQNWAKSKYIHTKLLEHSMAKAMEYLAREGQVDEALEILGIISEPEIPEKPEDGRIEAITKFYSYWVQQALNVQLLPLSEAKPFDVITILEKHLKFAIDHEVRPHVVDNKSISYWRMNINPQRERFSREDYKDITVTAIINTLYSACDQNEDGVQVVLHNFLQSEYEIFRRIAVHVLRQKGEKYPELLSKAYCELQRKPFNHSQYEFDYFIYDQFQNLPENIQREILDGYLANHNIQIQEVIEEQDKIIADQRLLFKLSQISDHLPDEERKLYKELLKEYGEPSPLVEPGVALTWSGPNSPYPEGELSEKSIEEIINILLTFEPEGDGFGGTPTREGLGRDFQKVVTSRSEEFAKNAELFLNENLSSEYYYHFFAGLEEALKNNDVFSLDSVIEFAIHICEKTEPDNQIEVLKSSLHIAKKSIASLFVKVFQVQEFKLNEENLKKIEEIIQKLVWEDEEYDRLQRTHEELAEEKAYDASTKSLNTIRGEAMHALIGLELYKARLRRKELGDDTSPIFDEWAKAIIIEKFDKTQDASLAVHSVIGQYVPQLMYLDKDWTVEKLLFIFPSDESQEQYWMAAWSAYVGLSDVYTSVFPELKLYYRRATMELPYDDIESPFIHIDRALSSHIHKAYLLDLIQLESKDELVKLFYQKATDEIRSQGVFWLSKVMETQKPGSEDKAWKKIWKLWQERLKQAIGDPENKANYQREISDYLRLLPNVPLDLVSMIDTIRKTIEFIKYDEFETDLLLKYLAEQSQSYPDLTVEILHQIIIDAKGLYLLSDMRKSIETIFKNAENASDESKQKVIELVNIFGERGDYSWRPWLERMV